MVQGGKKNKRTDLWREMENESRVLSLSVCRAMILYFHMIQHLTQCTQFHGLELVSRDEKNIRRMSWRESESEEFMVTDLILTSIFFPINCQRVETLWPSSSGLCVLRSSSIASYRYSESSTCNLLFHVHQLYSYPAPLIPFPFFGSSAMSVHEKRRT